MPRKLWSSAALATILAAGAAAGGVAAQRFDHLIPAEIERSSLLTLFAIFASSMLPVAAFTVSAIVTAAATASNSTTPRASRVVLSDGSGETVLAAIVAAFIYAAGGIFSLGAIQFGPAGRFVLFAGLIVAIVLVIFAFIRWIGRATRLGSQSANIESLGLAARNAVTADAVATFGAEAWDGKVPDDSAPVYPAQHGWVGTIDVRRIALLASRASCHVTLTVRPGDLAEPALPLAYISPAATAGDRRLVRKLRRALELETTRGDAADLRSHILALSETADRSLSPGVNDAGTAIAILNELLAVMIRFEAVQREANTKPPRHRRVSLPALAVSDVIDDAYTSIARDGAGTVEVVVALQRALATIARLGNAELATEAVRMSDIALELADTALPIAPHRDRAHAAAADVREAAEAVVSMASDGGAA